MTDRAQTLPATTMEKLVEEIEVETPEDLGMVGTTPMTWTPSLKRWMSTTKRTPQKTVLQGSEARSILQGQREPRQWQRYPSASACFCKPIVVYYGISSHKRLADIQESHWKDSFTQRQKQPHVLTGQKEQWSYHPHNRTAFNLLHGLAIISDDWAGHLLGFNLL